MVMARRFKSSHGITRRPNCWISYPYHFFDLEHAKGPAVQCRKRPIWITREAKYIPWGPLTAKESLSSPSIELLQPAFQNSSIRKFLSMGMWKQVQKLIISRRFNHGWDSVKEEIVTESDTLSIVDMINVYKYVKEKMNWFLMNESYKLQCIEK